MYYTTENYNRSFWNAVRGQLSKTTDLNEGTGESGGFILPSVTAERYAEALRRDNLFRRLGTVVQIPTSTGTVGVVASTADAEWVPEGMAFPESPDGFATYPFEVKKLAGLSKMRSDFISDKKFDVEGYLITDFARRFGRAEENACINGNGTTSPCGILDGAHGADVGVTAAAANIITFDEVIALYFSVKPEYRDRSTWVMNDETCHALRTMKDDSGNYLWRGAADTLIGKPVAISNHMPSAATGVKPIAFGDFSYYWITEDQPLAVNVLRERYALSGMIGLTAYERLDGRLTRSETIKVLQMAE